MRTMTETSQNPIQCRPHGLYYDAQTQPGCVLCRKEGVTHPESLLDANEPPVVRAQSYLPPTPMPIPAPVRRIRWSRLIVAACVLFAAALMHVGPAKLLESLFGSADFTPRAFYYTSDFAGAFVALGLIALFATGVWVGLRFLWLFLTRAAGRLYATRVFCVFVVLQLLLPDTRVSAESQQQSDTRTDDEAAATD